MNQKRLRRLYREEKLQVRKRGGRKRALAVLASLDPEFAELYEGTGGESIPPKCQNTVPPEPQFNSLLTLFSTAHCSSFCVGHAMARCPQPGDRKKP